MWMRPEILDFTIIPKVQAFVIWMSRKQVYIQGPSTQCIMCTILVENFQKIYFLSGTPIILSLLSLPMISIVPRPILDFSQRLCVPTPFFKE